MAQKANAISIKQVSAAAQKAVRAVQEKNRNIKFTTDGSIAHVPYWILGIPVYDLEVAKVSDINIVSTAIAQAVQAGLGAGAQAEAAVSHAAGQIEPASYQLGNRWILGYIPPDPWVFLKD